MNEQYAVIPPNMRFDGPNFGLAPGHVANGFMFVSGQLGFNTNGAFPENPKDQAINALENLRSVLQAANCDFSDIVSLETYHVGKCSEAMKWFIPTKQPYFSEPYPAWTAISVASLAADEAIIEIAAVVRIPT
ncbi:RidA family protein [Acinetobacter tandoii]|nr:RidA family protein [Acinetobacter tandoii]